MKLPKIVYEAKEGSSLTDGKPVNWGSYVASLTLGEEEETVTISVEY